MATIKKEYPVKAESYHLYEEIGEGASATVYRALCIPFNEIVAIKIMDCHRVDIGNITRESHTMLLVNHPNVVQSHSSFVTGHDLWLVMPYMDVGSCLHILKSAHPKGLHDEVAIATILREALKGLVYLHEKAFIHRDVKAGNILVDARTGAIKLGDLGVSACLFDSGERQRSRNTFVGTPCWMAPEVMESSQGYNYKADIWSFGITALELAHGHAPFSHLSPYKVLFMTLSQPAPGFADYDDDEGRKFSKSFKQMITACLEKDPSKRPSAEKLLKKSFFKKAKSSGSLVPKILKGLPLPTLGKRQESLKMKQPDILAQKQLEEKSQNEYKLGISNWNFNIDDIKEQAFLQETSDEEKDQGSSSTIAVASDGKKIQGKVVEQRGRFKVTSKYVCIDKVSSPVLRKSSSVR